MFDVWTGDVELTGLMLLLSAVVVLPGQLLLCFRAKRRMVRLLPAVLLGGITMAFILAALLINGWDGLGYVFLAIFSGMLLLACGLGWAIWAACFWRKKGRKANDQLDKPL